MNIFNLAKNIFQLGYEQGSNNGSPNKAKHNWELNKYFFEDDILKLKENTRQLKGLCVSLLQDAKQHGCDVENRQNKLDELLAEME